MSTPHECAATFFKILKSILVSHLELQSVTYRVETPCRHSSKSIRVTKLSFCQNDSPHPLWIIFCAIYSELSNKRGVFLVIFEKCFPTQCFFTYAHTKMEIMSQFHVYFSSTLNREFKVCIYWKEMFWECFSKKWIFDLFVYSYKAAL